MIMVNKILILTTTVKIPDNINDIYESINYYSNMVPEDIIDFLIIGDLIDKDKEKEIIEKCNELNNQSKYKYIKYLTYDEQKSFFNKYPLLDNIIFTRSIQRRNIGILEAIKQKYDYLISIDDDNYPLTNEWLYNFINYRNNEYHIINSCNGWIDVPYYITDIPSRGFPILSKNGIHDIYSSYEDSKNRIVCHQGFISGEADRSALHRYSYQDVNTDINNFNKNYIVDKSWCVFNTQNTLFKKEIFPLLFLFPMKKKLSNGYMIERYDDIFMSYIVNKIIHKFGWYISFGHPIMTQKRNEHDIEREVFTEMTGAIIAEPFIKFLQNVNLEEDTPLECYKEIALKLFEYSNSRNDSIFSYLKDMSKDMIIWYDIVSNIMSTNKI